jgi:hypothetical protein
MQVIKNFRESHGSPVAAQEVWQRAGTTDVGGEEEEAVSRSLASIPGRIPPRIGLAHVHIRAVDNPSPFMGQLHPSRPAHNAW